MLYNFFSCTTSLPVTDLITRRFINSIFASIILVVSATVQANSSVWKVSNGEHHLFLGGTIHLLSKNDYPLPEAFETAYAQAEDIWFETDASALTTEQVQKKMFKVMMYQDERNLSSVLDDKTYEELSDLLEDRGLSVTAFNKMTPAGAMFTLTGIELTRLGLIDQTAGVDLHFDQRAQQDNKDRLFLESVDEQIAFMQGINDLDPNRLIKSTIDQIDSTEQSWKELLTAWRSGDMQLMQSAGIEPMKADYPKIYKLLLVHRNRDWFSDIEDMLNSEEVELVLVGALHMVGEEGLINTLESAGYQVEQLD